MYLAHTKAAIVEALQAHFDAEYPYPSFRGLHVSIEYPTEQIEFPGILVDYDDGEPVEVAGIGHTEFIAEPDGSFGVTTRWRFAGNISLTVAAMSSQERDLLYDELVRMVGFSKDRETLGDFRARIESNDFVAMNVNFDSIKSGGKAEAPGTPWGSQEYIYEKSISLEVQGEFIGDPATQKLVPLRRVEVQMYRPPAESEPPFHQPARDDVLMPPGTDPFPKGWH